MNILITGANGFIGRALCRRLSADGYKIRGAVRGVTQMTALSSRAEEVQVGKIGSDTDWSKALNGVDTVVHLATRVHVMNDTIADPHVAFRWVNTTAMMNLKMGDTLGSYGIFVKPAVTKCWSNEKAF